MLTIGQNLRKYRLKKKMFQSELAEKIGVCTASVSHYEKDRADMNVLTMLSICDVLEISPNQLVCWNK